MAASSSSWKYDVFLSFRGEDTRIGFTRHLYAALCQKGISTFIDDERMKRGDELSPTLLAEIERSRISIVIFSEKYANSKWCLNELDKIMECRITRGQIVLPIFYHVDPSDVRNQTGEYQTAFVEHEKYNQSNVQKWRAALREAANLAGWDSTRTRFESELVESIVEDVLQKLNYIMDPIVPSGLVGIDKRIAQVESLFCDARSDDVCMVGLFGMCGVGKTTIAEFLFGKHFSQFQRHCFLRNVRDNCKRNGVNHVRNELRTQILGDRPPILNPNLVVNQLRQKKILIVLDDVRDAQQLEYLIGEKEWYGPGSRIIVTTRDKSVLQNNFDRLYNVMPLDYDEAHQLFCLSAFKQDLPESEFMQLTHVALDYAGGNPLALKVLGSNLHSKNRREWESALQKLKKLPPANIDSVLRLSYQELDHEEQQVFLDIACFLKGEKKQLVTSFFDGCSLLTEIAMRTLQDRCLMTIEKDQTVWMHDLIQQMGFGIIREEYLSRPEKRSRLWDADEVYNVLKHGMGTDAIEGIALNMSEVKDLFIMSKTFATMTSLRFVNFFLPEGKRACNVHIPEGIEVLPTKLRYLHWDCFPTKALPEAFNTKNLVKLDLRNSLLEKLWDGEKDLANLKSIDLSGSKSLVELPDLSSAVNLEELHLGFCTSLREVPSYVLSLDHLLALNLEGCTQLQCLRSDVHLKSLQWLDLSGCSNLVEFSFTSDKLEYLSLKDTGIEELSPSVWQNKNLSCLFLSGCLRLKKLPPIVGTSSSITSLFLDGCSNLSELPDNLYVLNGLDTLSLQGSCIETLPARIKHVSKLRSLNVSHCKRLAYLPELPPSLSHLNAKGCTSLEKLPISVAAPFMQDLLNRPELKMSLHHFHCSDMFEFNKCIGLDVNVDGSITRIRCAAYLSSVAKAYNDPYHQFQIFSKDYDAETLESACRQLCVRSPRGNIPERFHLQEIESSSMIIKLNANCCSNCKSSDFAFGLFQTDKEEDLHFKFSGRHRICVKQMVKSPMWRVEKLWCNDVRVCFPGNRIPSCFIYRKTDQTRVAIELRRSSELLGFAFCVISSHYPSISRECFPMIRCECHLDDAEGIGPFQSDYCYPCDLECESTSDSVFIWYDARTSNSILEAIEKNSDADRSTPYNPRISFQFYSKSGIKECAVWLIYESDIEPQILALKKCRPSLGPDEQQLPIDKNQDKNLQALLQKMKLNREIRRTPLILKWRLQSVIKRKKARTPSSSNKQKQLPLLPRKKSKRSLHIEELAQFTRATENHDELQRLHQTKKLKKRPLQIPGAMYIFSKALNPFLMYYAVSTGIAFH